MPKVGRLQSQTVPAIKDEISQDGAIKGSPTQVADSWLIAQYLESKYPSTPPLFPNGTLSIQKYLMDVRYDSDPGPEASILCSSGERE